jgi:hypothetical protein
MGKRLLSPQAWTSEEPHSAWTTTWLLFKCRRRITSGIVTLPTEKKQHHAKAT